MSLDANTLLAIIGMALATYLTRIAGLWLLRLANVGGRARSAMDALPPAVLMAVIAPTVLATGLAETLAAGITVMAAFRLPLLVSVATGVASVVGLRMLIG
ncbi:AzlD domain-containing protein [Anderseniella sp. Alg231-50]|uniref:AzlD domain-containing protein n=1 Tax=Anderseniella sp. Alg231-50 TaxID=1922226 RepID=UPI000D557098